jgi:hypothetical protein
MSQVNVPCFTFTADPDAAMSARCKFAAAISLRSTPIASTAAGAYCGIASDNRCAAGSTSASCPAPDLLKTSSTAARQLFDCLFAGDSTRAKGKVERDGARRAHGQLRAFQNHRLCAHYSIVRKQFQSIGGRRRCGDTNVNQSSNNWKFLHRGRMAAGLPLSNARCWPNRRLQPKSAF